MCTEPTNRFSIRSFADGDPVAPITSLLHAAYRPLAEKGFRYVATHQDDATTLRRLKSGRAFLAETNGEVVGTITLYAPSADSPVAWYRRPGVYRFGQFGVRPDLQHQGIGHEMYLYIERLARDLDATELALDTAEGATRLRDWYARLGFRVVAFNSWPQTNYRSVILSKAL